MPDWVARAGCDETMTTPRDAPIGVEAAGAGAGALAELGGGSWGDAADGADGAAAATATATAAS